MAFKQTHSTIPDDIIYHIECNGKVYIGQSKDGFNRIQTHCTDSFRHPETAGMSSDGADVIYQEMRQEGLYQTNILYYAAPNYGLSDYDFYWFFNQFIPANMIAKDWHPNNATQDQKRDAAEILHILHERLSGQYEVVNKSMGGQGGSYRYRADSEYIKLLTRTMTPEDALRIINASDVSKKNLISMVNLVNKYLFTDEWKNIYNQVGNKSFKLPGQIVQGHDALTWSEFVSNIVVPLLPSTIVQYFKKQNFNPTNKNSDLYKQIESFVYTKEAYLKYFLTQASYGGAFLTQAEQNLIKNNNAHLFTAKLDLQPMIDYLAELFRNTIISLSKKGQYSPTNTGNKTETFSGAIRITGLFNVSSLHMRGTNTDYIANLRYSDRHTVGKIIKVGFSLTTFQYFYKRSARANFSMIPQRYIEWEVDGDPDMIAIHSMQLTDQDSSGYWMSARNVPVGSRLTDLLMQTYLTYQNTWIFGIWSFYMKDMMHFLRQYNFADATLNLYLVSNGRDVWLTDDNYLGRRIYFTDVYHETEAAKALANVTFY